MPCCRSAGALMVMDKFTARNDSCDTLLIAIIGPSWWWTDHLPRFIKFATEANQAWFASVAPHCKWLQKSGRRGKVSRNICLVNSTHNWCSFRVLGHFEPVSHLLTSRCAWSYTILPLSIYRTAWSPTNKGTVLARPSDRYCRTGTKKKKEYIWGGRY